MRIAGEWRIVDVMSQPAPEREEYDDWRALQDVLEERDAEYWAAEQDD